MQSFKEKVENLCFLDNSPTYPYSKDSTLVCLHAAIMHREAIPRIFIPEDFSYENKLLHPQNLIHICLYSNCEDILKTTSMQLKSSKISLNDVYKISNIERQHCLQIVEECLQELCGFGVVHYEMSRFSPFEGDDILQFMNGLNFVFDDSTTLVFKRLQERSVAKAQYCYKYSNIIQKLNLTGEWDSYHSVIKFKLEQLWQQSWKDNTHYQLNDNIINSIIVGDFGEM